MKGNVKMKYVSEITNKTYGTEAECLEDEKIFLEKKAKAEEEKKLREQALTSEKKELALKIDNANKAIKDAQEAYDKAKDECAKILEESNDKVIKILSDARKVLDEAKAERFNKIVEFNKKFGPYRTSFTGEEAEKELNKINKEFKFDNLFNWVFDWLNV